MRKEQEDTANFIIECIPNLKRCYNMLKIVNDAQKCVKQLKLNKNQILVQETETCEEYFYLIIRGKVMIY